MSAMDNKSSTNIKDRVNGTVKWFSGLKGFGFIAPDSGGEDLFVHQSSIRSEGFRTLSEGELVEFFVDIGQDGRTRAVDVIRLGGVARVSGGSRRGGGVNGEGERGRGGYGYGRYGDGGGGGGGGNVRGGMGGRRGGRVAMGDGGYKESGGGVRGGECYNCGRYGHLARECYVVTGEGRGRGRIERGGGGGGRGSRDGYAYGGDRGGSGGGGGRGSRDGYAYGGGRGGSGGGGGGRRCYNCSREGHFARDCSNERN